MTIESVLHRSAPKSRFVTVVAWLGIFSGASTVVAAAWSLIMEPRIAAVAALPAGLLAAIAGIGLNDRREWARQAFILVQAYGILYLLVDAAIALSKHRLVPPTDVTQQVPVAFTLVFFCLFVAFNSWIIAKLCSRRIRAEFEAAEEDESE